jgi:hypothetical protein
MPSVLTNAKILTSPVSAERANALGWDAVALFGCRRHRPLDPLWQCRPASGHK